jgi:hypothetical protein
MSDAPNNATKQGTAEFLRSCGLEVSQEEELQYNLEDVQQSIQDLRDEIEIAPFLPSEAELARTLGRR